MTRLQLYIKVTRNGVLIGRKTAADWMFSDVVLSRKFAAADTLSWTWHARTPKATAPVQEGDEITLEQVNSRTGSAVVRFVGEVFSSSRGVEGGSVGKQFTAVNVWQKIEDTDYLQEWSSAGHGMTLVHLLLNTETVVVGGYPNLPGTALISCGQQIYDVVKFLRDELGVAIEIGTARDATEPVGLYLPSIQKFDIKCWEAIRVCLEKAPDVLGWFDYSSGTPTLYLRRRANFTDKVLTLSQSVQASEINGRNDLTVPGIHYIYVSSDTVNDAVVGINTAHDYWPQGDLWDDAKKRHVPSVLTRRSLTQTIILEGSSTAVSEHEFTGQVTAPDDGAWWEQHIAELQDVDEVQSWSMVGWTLYDQENEPLSLPAGTWWEVTGGSVPPFVDGVAVVNARFILEATVDYKDKGLDTRQFQFDATLTNIEPGTYSKVSSYQSAEPRPPDGTAKMIFDALSQTYYEGSVRIVEQDCSGAYGLDTTYSLKDKDGNWIEAEGGIKALPQEVVEDFDSGATTVRFGLPRWLGFADVLDFVRISRSRIKWQDSTVMGDGARIASGGSVGMPKATANANGVPQDPKKHVLNVIPSGDATSGVTVQGADKATPATVAPAVIVRKLGVENVRVESLAGCGKITVDEPVDQSTQLVRILIDPKDISSPTETELTSAGKVAKFRKVTVCVNTAADGQPEQLEQREMFVLGTEPEAP